MIIIAQNLRELTDNVVYLRTNCNDSDYPTEFQTYDEGWGSLRQSLDHLRAKLGDIRYAQLMEMVEQAKAHYDAGYASGPKPDVRSTPDDLGLEHIKLGSWLMQDIEQVVKGKKPFAYPEELYSWSR
jgi:hypothetical protein